MSNQEDYSREVSEEVLREIEEYEEKYLKTKHTRSKRSFPSNEDVAEAVRAITGGVITRHSAEELYTSVKKYLESRGFDTSRLTEGRLWRLVTSMVKKGILRVIE